MSRLYVSRGCENIPVITVENSPGCHQMGGKYYESVCRQVCVTHRTILLCLFSETGDAELPHHTDQDPLATASTSLLFPHVDEFGESEKCVLARVCVKVLLFAAMHMKLMRMTFRICWGSK